MHPDLNYLIASAWSLKKLANNILCGVLFLCCGAAIADDTKSKNWLCDDLWVSMSLISQHHGSKSKGKPYNEENYGLGLECALNKNWSLKVGQYENSIYKRSEYYGVFYSPSFLQFREPLFKSDIRVGVTAAGLTGYEHNKVSPMVAAMIAWEKKDLFRINNARFGVGLNILHVPPYEDRSVTALQGKLLVQF